MMSYNEDTEVDGQHHFCQEFGAELFKDGVKWAINEFLKDLWHDKAEIPSFKEDGSRPIVSELYSGYGKYEYTMFYYVRPTNWRYKTLNYAITRWCYIDDLLPK